MNKLIVVIFSVFSVLISAILLVYLQIPGDKKITGCITTEMYKVDLCPSSKTYVPLSRISKYLQKTVVLTEDSTFFQHDGFDWESIEKNAKENFEKGQYKRGGSTISQQLAKNLFLSKEKTMSRKFFEFFITMKIEKLLSKKEILERYLNVVEFGKNIYGVRSAASFYFQKSPSELSVVESAFLAMLLPNPVKYSASFHKKQLTPFAKKRLSRIVNDMVQYQRITPEEHSIAMAELQSFLNYAAGGSSAEPTLEADGSLEPLEDEFQLEDEE